MAIRKGLPAKNAATDADDTRYDFGGLVVQNSDGSPRGGLLGSVRSIVSSRANMAVDVAAFTAAAVRDGGVILLANDGTVTVSITTAPASNSRYTVVYAKQNDSSSTVTTPDANDTPVIGTVDGTAAASPVKPSLPVGAVELATIQVPAGATATNAGGVVITQAAQYTAMSGGVVPFRLASQMQAWVTPQPYQRAAVEGDTAAAPGEYMWNGAGWTRSSGFAMAQGIGTIGSVAAGVSINSTITFPTGRFTQPPFVYAMPASSRVTASLSSTSTTGATLNFGNWSPGAMASTGFWWLAIQMTPGTSDG